MIYIFACVHLFAPLCILLRIFVISLLLYQLYFLYQKVALLESALTEHRNSDKSQNVVGDIWVSKLHMLWQ